MAFGPSVLDQVMISQVVAESPFPDAKLVVELLPLQVACRCHLLVCPLGPMERPEAWEHRGHHKEGHHQYS